MAPLVLFLAIPEKSKLEDKHLDTRHKFICKSAKNKVYRRYWLISVIIDILLSLWLDLGQYLFHTLSKQPMATLTFPVGSWWFWRGFIDRKKLWIWSTRAHFITWKRYGVSDRKRGMVLNGWHFIPEFPFSVYHRFTGPPEGKELKCIVNQILVYINPRSRKVGRRLPCDYSIYHIRLWIVRERSITTSWGILAPYQYIKHNYQHSATIIILMNDGNNINKQFHFHNSS